MPYAPAFIRSAPPTVPGTPISPSMPPKLFFAQNVTVRPRSAAASTVATFPFSEISGSPFTSCSTTNGNSPSTTSKFEPPPRNLCGTAGWSSNFSKLGMASCRRMRNRSVVPPIPREVSSARETSRRSSVLSSGSAARILASSIRISNPVLHPKFRSQQHHQLAARAADVSRANRQDRIAGAGFAQQKLDRILHRAEILHVFVSCLANTVGQGLARDAGNRRFTRRVNIHQRQHIGFVEGAHKFVPQMLRPRVAMRLKERKQAVELAASRGFERRTNLRRVVSVIVHHGDIVHDAFDIEPPAHTSKFCQPFADQVAGYIQIKRYCPGGGGVSNIVDSGRVRQQKHSQVLTLVSQ